VGFLKNSAEIIAIRLNDFRTRKWIRKLRNLIRNCFLPFILYILPLNIGVILKLIYNRYYSLHIRDFESITSLLLEYWLILPFFIINFYFAKRNKEYRSIDYQTKYIYHYVKYIYSDLGFDIDNPSNVRCTLWTPTIKRRVDEKDYEYLLRMRLKQVIDYYPGLSGLHDGFLHRIHSTSGRKRRVCRSASLVSNDIEPIGIVGECATQSMSNGGASIIVATIGDDETFVKYMQEKWHFLPLEAKKLTRDRKSYLGITLMDRYGTDILGVLFFDSPCKNAFAKYYQGKEGVIGNDDRHSVVLDSSVTSDIQKHLPGLAYLLIK
jgi:hypothetical protein